MKIRSLRRIALFFLFFSINFEMWDPLSSGGVFSLSALAGYFYLTTIINEIPAFIRIRSFKKYAIPLVLFFIYLSIINFLNLNATSSIFIDFTILQDIILFILLVNHERKDPGILEKGMLSLAIGAVVLSICFILGFGVSSYADRVTLFGDNQNVIGIKEAIGCMVLLLTLMQNPLKLKRWRFVLLLFVPMMLLLMAQTGSRVAFLSFGLMFIVGLLLYQTKRKYIKGFILILGLLIGLVTWQYLSKTSILYQRLQMTEHKHDIGGRDRIWDVVVPFMEKNLIFGKGESGYTEYITNLTGAFESPHNVILEVLCYTGIIGLFLYLLFLYRIFWISFKKWRLYGALMPILLLIPIAGLLFSAQILTVKVCYIIFANSISSIFVIRKKISRKSVSKKTFSRNKTNFLRRIHTVS